MTSSKGEGLGTMSPEMSNVREYYRWIYDVLRPFLDKRVLEIGPGFGNLAEWIVRDAELYCGLDTQEEVIECCRSKFESSPKFRWLVGDLGKGENLEALRTMRIGTVVAVNILEHIQDESLLLRRLPEISPGGRFLMVVPAHPFLYGSFDRQAGHYRRYTLPGLKRVLDRAGFQVEWIRRFNALGAIGWWFSAVLLKQQIGSSSTSRMVRFYDRWGIPLARALDKCLNPFFGQSLIASARIRSI